MIVKVISGFDTALNVINPTPYNSNGIDQEMYYELGDSWIVRAYPNVSVIVCSTLILDIDDDGKSAIGTLDIIMITMGSILAFAICVYLCVFGYRQIKLTSGETNMVGAKETYNPLTEDR